MYDKQLNPVAFQRLMKQAEQRMTKEAVAWVWPLIKGIGVLAGSGIIWWGVDKGARHWSGEDKIDQQRADAVAYNNELLETSIALQQQQAAQQQAAQQQQQNNTATGGMSPAMLALGGAGLLGLGYGIANWMRPKQTTTQRTMQPKPLSSMSDEEFDNFYKKKKKQKGFFEGQEDTNEPQF